jgi:hypothetical protein
MCTWEQAIAQVMALTTPGIAGKPQTRTDVIAYFEARYPGERTLSDGTTRHEWKEKLTDALQTTVVDKNDRPYKRASLARRFQFDARTGQERYKSARVTAKQQEEYKAVGALLPTIKARPPKGGYHVSYSGGVRFSKCEAVDFDVDITGTDAQALAENPELLEDIVMSLYLEDDESGIGFCSLEDGVGREDIEVSANDDDFQEQTREYQEKSAHVYARPFAKR